MKCLPLILLAQNAPGDLLKPSRLQFPADLLFLLGAVCVLVLLFLTWAMFLRKRKDELSGWKVERRQHSSNGQSDASGHHHHRRRRRRREHRPRNPTLAETGGLPPARPEPPPDSTT
jgi:hypothetical protein